MCYILQGIGFGIIVILLDDPLKVELGRINRSEWTKEKLTTILSVGSSMEVCVVTGVRSVNAKGTAIDCLNHEATLR